MTAEVAGMTKVTAMSVVMTVTLPDYGSNDEYDHDGHVDNC